MENNTPEMTLDLESVIVKKMHGKKPPRFLMNFLNRFLQVDFINGYLAKGKVGIDFCTGVSEYLNINMIVEGLENVPNDGRLYTFVSNHPLGGADGVALAGLVGSNFGSVKMPVNDFLMALPGLRPICIPINKTGGQARDLPRLMSDAFSSSDQMLVFPAGLCSRIIDGKVQDVEWTKTFITQSVKNQRDIVPIHFIGENSPRFYRIARFCKMLKMKFNLAMLFLPDELFRAKGKTFRIIVGRPIPYTTFDQSKTAKEWAAWVREEVYKLD